MPRLKVGLHAAACLMLPLLLAATAQHPQAGSKENRLVTVWEIQSSGRTVTFAALAERGLIRSIDNGRSWQPANDGLPPSIGSAAITPIVAIAGGSLKWGPIFALTEIEGVFRSDNDGANWQRASDGLPVPLHHRTEGSLLAVDPDDSNKVYTLLKVPVHSHRDDAILFASSNGGSAWSPLKNFGGAAFAAMTVEHSGRIHLVEDDGDDYTVNAPTPVLNSGDQLTSIQLISNGGVTALQKGLQTDMNGIAVIEDDGTLVSETFDLPEKSLEFRPTGDGSYEIVLGIATLSTDIGTKVDLADEDAKSLALPFAFPFYGQPRRTLFINSNGNLSFERPERSSVDTFGGLVTGAPRIAPLWFDADPGAAGGVYVNASQLQVIITWNAVPLWRQTAPNTFQVTLKPNGAIRFDYGEIAVSTGTVGISNGYQFMAQPVNYTISRTLDGLTSLPIAQTFRAAAIDPGLTAQRFYATHDDDYDALVLWAASEYPRGVASGSTAYYLPVKNDVRGIGQAVGGAAGFTTDGKLQGIVNLNRLSTWPDDVNEKYPESTNTVLSVFAQEWGHRFGAYVRFKDGLFPSSALLGRQSAHWNYFFNSDASVIEGNEWEDQDDGSFKAVNSVAHYSKLDQYLMGLRSAAEVGPLFVITNPQPLLTGTIESLLTAFGVTDSAIQETGKDFSNDKLKNFFVTIDQSSFGATINRSGRTEEGPRPDVLSTASNLRQTLTAAPGKTYHVRRSFSSEPQFQFFDATTGKFTGDNIVMRGTRKDLSVANIIDVEGERLPIKGTAPTAFRKAFILVVPPGQPVTSRDLTKLGSIRTAWESYYNRATDGLSTVSARLDAGISHMLRAIPGGGLISSVSPGTAATATAGWGRVEGRAERVSAVAFLTGRRGNQVITEAAIPALGTVQRARFFVEKTPSIDTGVAIAAPLAAASITFQLRNTDGTVAAASSMNLAAGAQSAKFASELFSSFTFPATFRGTATASSSAPIVLLSLRTAINESSEFLMTAVPAANLDTTPSSIAYLPHFADGGGYSTDLVLMNPGSSPMTGTVEFRAPDGTASTVSLVGSSSTATYRLEAHAVQIFPTAGGTSIRVGSVRVRPDTGQDSPVVRGIVTLRQEGKLVAMTGYTPAPSSTRGRVLVDLGEGHDSGVAVVNTSSSPAQIRFVLTNKIGGGVQLTAQATLQPGAQTATMVSQLYQNLPRNFQGTMDIISDVPVNALTLRSTSSGSRFLVAAFPVEPLDIPQAERVLYLPHIVDGGGFSTTVFVMNLGSDFSAPRLDFFTQNRARFPVMTIPIN